MGEKKSKFVKRKKLFLTRSQRKDLNLLKLPKDGWNYNDLQLMRNMWMEYMRKNLGLIKKTPSCEESSWCNLSSILTKSEFIGAEITVIRSTVPSTVGITGTVVLETKSTFQVVTPNSQLKNLLKRPSVFVFTLDGRKFTIFGKHLNIKPNERSIKKIKISILPDI
ncbi:hypothetical protein ILUMI_18500 [Ignelater luminosus]|nr:hypothetical protein ILUMI_18500 [Ignelater luminosus]